MPWAHPEVRSRVRPGVVRENHSGVSSGAAETWTFMPCLRCFTGQNGSSTLMRSVGLRGPSLMAWLLRRRR